MATTAATTDSTSKNSNIIRRLYDWVLSLADSPHGVWMLFALSFAESSFFPVPPDVLLIALAIAKPGKSFRYATICMAGSLLGGITGYGIGYLGYEVIGKPIIHFYNGEEIMLGIKAQYDKLGFWGVLIAAVTPIPYKVFTISSGFFEFDFMQFVVASIVGRSVRFFAVATLIWKLGAPIRTFIDKYFNLLAFIFVILLIFGFVFVKFVLS